MRRAFITLLVIVFALLGGAAAAQVAAAAAPKPKKLTLTATKKVLTVGETFTVKVKSATPAKASKAVKWSSSNRKVATVSASGKIKALKAGTVTIKATSKVSRKVTAKLKLTVRAKPADPQQPVAPNPAGPGTPTEPTAPPVIDPKLLGSWSLFASGAGATVTYHADGTWDQVIIFRGSISNLETFTQGKYRAEGGKLTTWDIITRSRKDDSEPWGDWRPAAEPTQVMNYVVGTDEYGEYLVTEPDPNPITEESVKYRRR
jgi:hypothetical protein